MRRNFIAGVLVVCGLATLAVVAWRPKRPPMLPEPSQPVGAIDGVFSASGSGAATYRIPIEVPPGTSGVTPRLELSYESRRGNGYLGIGWALAGLSSIARCNASYALDGFKAGVEFTDRDRFCLDGIRLVAVKGAYGADGTVYHTETETWTVVTSHGACGAGPCRFSALNKDGDTLSFGATTGTTGSRVPASGRSDGAVRVWAIDRFTNLNQGYTSVTYLNDAAGGEYHPVAIDYTGNSATGLLPARKIALGYEPRPDVLSRFIGGSPTRISRRLATITTSVSGGRVLEYQLAYQPSAATGRSRLASITVCDAAGVCLPATRFDWYTAPHRFAPAASPAPSLPGPLYVVSNGISYVEGVLVDFNGDGIGDYCRATEIAGAPATRYKVHFGHADGTFSDAGFELPGPLFRVGSQTVVRVGVLVDINGDGLLDYSPALENDDVNPPQTDLTVHLGTGRGFVKTVGYQLPGPLYIQTNGTTLETGILIDLDGDGLVDYSRATRHPDGAQLLTIHKGTGSGFQKTDRDLPGPLFQLGHGRSYPAGVLRDLNGDGIPDYSPAFRDSLGTDHLQVSVGATPGFRFTYAFDLPGPMYWQVGEERHATGVLLDINGDGIADYTRATWLPARHELDTGVKFGTGAGYTDIRFNLPGPVYVLSGSGGALQGLLSDLDGDGTVQYSRATEVLGQPPELEIHRGGSVGFADAGFALPGPLFRVGKQGTWGHGIYEDINGDGIADYAKSVCLLEKDGGLSTCELEIRLAEGPFTDLMKSVTTGFNGVTSIEYSPLSSAVFTPGPPVAYPVRNVQGTMYVVSRYRLADGRGNEYAFRNQYQGSRVELLGRGWLGFSSITQTEEATGRSTRVTYEPDAPCQGLSRSNEAFDADGKLLTRNDYTYVDVAPPDLKARGIHQPLKSRESEIRYTAGKPEYSIEKRYQYDEYGNTTLISDLGNPAETGDDVFYCTRYLNDAATNRLGYLEQLKVGRTLAGCQAFVAGSLQWNPANDLRWSKTDYDERRNVVGRADYDDSNGVFLSRRYHVDAYGNILTATDPAGKTSTFTYDEGLQTFLATSTTPPLGSYSLTTRYNYDPASGQLLATTDPNGNTVTRMVDGFGRPVGIHGPSPTGVSTLLAESRWKSEGGRFFTESHARQSWSDGDDPKSWPWTRAYYDGLLREYRSEVSALKDDAPAVKVTEVLFDAAGRIGQEAYPHYDGDPAPFVTTEYDPLNRPTAIIDPSQVVERLEYRRGGLEVSHTLAYGTPDARTELDRLDVRGRTVEHVAANGLERNHHYDPIGQLERIETSPTERSVKQHFDSLGRLRTRKDSDSVTVTWAFDPAGLLKQIDDGAGNTVSFEGYDGLGRPSRRTLAYGGQTATVDYHYDDPSQQNGRGRLTGVAMSQAPLGQWSYAYGYDAFGNAATAQVSLLGRQFTYSATTDPLGRTASFTYPDGSVLSHSYGADANLQAIELAEPGGEKEALARYSAYTALGEPTQIDLKSNGVKVARDYFPIDKAFGRLKTTTVTSTRQKSTLYAKQYTWNKLSALSALDDLIDPADSETFGYEDQAANRKMGFLTSATGRQGRRTYQYDPVGNLKQRDDVQYSYAPGKDQLSSSSAGASYSFYDNGYLKTRSEGALTWKFQYDALGEWVGVERSGEGATQSAAAVYDHAGRTVFQTALGRPGSLYRIGDNYEVSDLGNGEWLNTKYVDGVTGPLVAITRSGNGLRKVVAAPRGARDAILALAVAASLGLALRPRRRRRSAWVVPSLVAALLFAPIGPALAALTPGANGVGVPTVGRTWFVQDHLGSTVSVTDDQGRQTARLAYQPFGAVDEARSSGVDNFAPKFNAKRWDTGARLYHFGARAYDPSAARFISPDPAHQFISPYVYGGNSPLTLIDPSGALAFVPILVAAAAIVVGTAVGAALGAYFGGAAVNHSFNPLHWDWQSGKTYAGLLAGAGIGAVGGAAGGIFVEAGVAIGGIGGIGATAVGIAVGIVGEVLVGAFENAAFAALGGGSAKEMIEAALLGGVMGGVAGALGAGIGLGASALGRMALRAEAELPGLEEVEVGMAGRGCSFPAGTPVLAEGGREIAIERIGTGERLFTRDLGRAKNALQPVEEQYRRQVQTLVELTLASGTTLAVTPEHPLYVENKGFIAAQHLLPGDRLVRAEGEPVAVTASLVRQNAAPVTVYNFSVAEQHNYFVSRDHVLAKNGKYCTSSYSRGTVTDRWSDSSLKKRFPRKKDYQAVLRDIRAKTRNANRLLDNGTLQAWTRVDSPVRTASREMARDAFQRRFPGVAVPSSVREIARLLRPSVPLDMDWDEFISRIFGGLTIREGYPENQGPIVSFVNVAVGGAHGGISRSGVSRPIFRFQSVIE